VAPDQLEQVLDAGWQLEKRAAESVPGIDAEDIRRLQTLISLVDLTGIRPAYLELVQKLRNAGVAVSDRRAVKLQRLIAASALLCKRDRAIQSDLWVLRYIWDTDEQVEVIAGIVNSVVEADPEKEQQHPRASQSNSPDPDAMFREVSALTEQWENPETSPADRATIKDRLRYLSGRAEWIGNEVQRNYVQAPIDALWSKIVQTA
jgi:MoxR-like ATPase